MNIQDSIRYVTCLVTRSTFLPHVVLLYPLAVLCCPLVVLVYPFVVLACPLVISVCPLIVLVVLSVRLFITITDHFFCIDNFYCLCIFITCDEQTFNYSVKVSLILKDATKICFLFRICMPQILMVKPRPVNFYIKVNNHVHQDLQKSF